MLDPGTHPRPAACAVCVVGWLCMLHAAHWAGSGAYCMLHMGPVCGHDPAHRLTPIPVDTPAVNGLLPFLFFVFFLFPALALGFVKLK